MKEDDKQITNNELAGRIDTVAVSLARFIDETKRFIEENRQFQQDVRAFQTDTNRSLRELQAGVFTVDEKEEVMSVVGHINQQIENDALGKSDIALTRPEYDATAEAAGFSNRFTQPSEAWAQ